MDSSALQQADHGVGERAPSWSRVEYERFALRFGAGEVGPDKGPPLVAVDRAIVGFLATNAAKFGPGSHWHQDTIARSLGMHRLQVQRGMARLRLRRLVLVEELRVGAKLRRKTEHERAQSSRRSSE